jgi:mRNA-degrading endonuclease RelE of RelBE toxin-antitoxin system
MYQLVIDRYAEKQLAKIPPPDFNRIVKAINQLATDPGQMATKNLQAVPVTEYVLAITE